jgi:hypothetical protein
MPLRIFQEDLRSFRKQDHISHLGLPMNLKGYKTKEKNAHDIIKFSRVITEKIAIAIGNKF